ncbi:acyl-CoA synthetase (AMP-forming)/AMP-acid ligase II [Caldalkalibacillus uzonensis]|uniref:Acyl-CoA synthetase (AMP-forming)/AMP-acid ligase II n=1 Tax=Caldalkalibacillus uzonensis TaxID=353224 RepID=A0ABU0CVT6_9BACI|nr:acyl-CoA synthetase (AMP-forming)/AMP-acid ligase II [Caldalkalibacillus uzonensis]
MGIGLSKGDRVGIYMKNNPFYVFSLFAIGKAGLVEVPINPNFREPEILHIINTAHVSTIIVEANMEFINILSKISSESSVLKNVIIVGDIKKNQKWKPIYIY